MESIYEGMSAEDLVEQVSNNGLSTKKEDIRKAREIFGKTANKNLIDMAKSARLAQAFYVILFNIWNYQEANEFCNNHSSNSFKEMAERNNKLAQELEAAKLEAEENQEDCKLWETRCNSWMERCRSAESDHAETVREMEFYQDGYEAAHREIIELKAKLYDLMVAKEGK